MPEIRSPSGNQKSCLPSCSIQIDSSQFLAAAKLCPSKHAAHNHGTRSRVKSAARFAAGLLLSPGSLQHWQIQTSGHFHRCSAAYHTTCADANATECLGSSAIGRTAVSDVDMRRSCSGGDTCTKLPPRSTASIAQEGHIVEDSRLVPGSSLHMSGASRSCTEWRVQKRRRRPGRAPLSPHPLLVWVVRIATPLVT